MASTGPQDFPSLTYTLGVVFIAVIACAGIWGIATAQTYWYYTTYPKDPTGVKLLVAIVWTVDTVNQALVSFIIYNYVITNYFNPPALNELHSNGWIIVLLEIMCTFLVQSFFLKRIWHLSNRRLILIVLPAVFIVGRLVVGLVWIAQAIPQTNIADLNSQGRTLSEWVHGLGTGGETLLAGLMVYLLHISRTGLRQTDNLINKLMLYAVTTSAVTGLFSIGTLVCLLAFPNTLIFTFFYNCVGQLYVTCMLASLNARKHLRDLTPTFMEMSLANALGGDSRGPTSQSRVDVQVSKQSNPDGAFERSRKMGAYISKIERDSEPVHEIV